MHKFNKKTVKELFFNYYLQKSLAEFKEPK